MIKVQLLGTRNKTDLSIFLGRSLVGINKRVLIVDTTKDRIYKYGIAELETGDAIYEVQGVEILCTEPNSWDEVISSLDALGESIHNYDVIICDFDSKTAIKSNWGDFERTLYVGDSDRYNLYRDMEMLHLLLDLKGESYPVQQIHFQSGYHVPADYIEMLMNNRLVFSDVTYHIEFDPDGEGNRVMMQHNQIVPFNRIAKDYRSMINELVSSWTGALTLDVSAGVKEPLLSRFFKKKQDSKEV